MKLNYEDRYRPRFTDHGKTIAEAIAKIYPKAFSIDVVICTMNAYGHSNGWAKVKFDCGTGELHFPFATGLFGLNYWDEDSHEWCRISSFKIY